MLKGTSLVSVISATELLTTVENIYSVNFEIIALLIVACIWYLVATTIASAVQARIERRYAKGTR
jgi:polar amino acid transport system permease protein